MVFQEEREVEVDVRFIVYYLSLWVRTRSKGQAVADATSMYVPDARHEHLAIAPEVGLVTGKVYALTMRREIAVCQHEVLDKALYIVVK